MAEEISVRDQRTEVGLPLITETPLTAQEVSMLQGYADGKSMPTIGYEAGLSTQMAKNKFTAIREKLDAVNSTNAVAIGIRRGIID